MISRHSVRHIVQAAIAAQLDAATDSADVTVMDGIVARDVTQETIGIGPLRSVQTDMPYMQAGRKQRRDRFSFDVYFAAAKPDQRTPAEAKERAAAMFAWLEDIIADDPTITALAFATYISSYSGPDAEPLAPGGFGGYITATVECWTQQN